jgi:UDP-N-acetylglucosamine--N-acetylmuramyl-(pentapeptide) pyrophosphoryl-undecaprenol N-acetylglucosamine transferase
MRRLLLAGGGTGGHVYPLLAVLEVLPEATEVLYLGRRDSVEERLATKHGVPFQPMPSAGVRGMAPWRVAANLARVTAGVGSALAAMRRFEPDAVLVTGGYVSVPPAMAAWLTRRPLVVCLPDMEPGLAVQFLARLADRVTVSFPEVQRTLPANKAVVTGYPVRRAFVEGDREAARARLGLRAGERLLVVLGGSSGARNINNAVLGCLTELVQVAKVLHITGNLDYERVLAAARAACPDVEPGRLGADGSPLSCTDGQYRIYSYVEDGMADVLRAADLVVARAGAATLGEFPAVGVPSILVPGTFAGGHQRLNATYLRDHGASIVVEDDRLAEELLPTVRRLMADPQRLADMAAAAGRLAGRQASRAIVTELQHAAQGRSRSGGR